MSDYSTKKRPFCMIIFKSCSFRVALKNKATRLNIHISVDYNESCSFLPKTMKNFFFKEYGEDNIISICSLSETSISMFLERRGALRLYSRRKMLFICGLG